MLCKKCGRDLPEDAYPLYWDKCRGKHYRRNRCKECGAAYAHERYMATKHTRANTYEPAYSPGDLRYRPIEQVIECIGCRELALALECNKDTAARIKQDPSSFVDTPMEIDDAKVRQIRAWLESVA